MTGQKRFSADAIFIIPVFLIAAFVVFSLVYAAFSYDYGFCHNCGRSWARSSFNLQFVDWGKCPSCGSKEVHWPRHNTDDYQEYKARWEGKYLQ